MNDILKMMLEAGCNAPSAENACNCESARDERLVKQRIFLDDTQYFEVEVPVIRCGGCGFEFTDHRAETLRHMAACHHEGLLAPEEVKEIRENLGMTRKVFGEAFGIPPASMERWENGKLMQNKSMDTLLRSLKLPGVAPALDRRNHFMSSNIGDNVVHVNFAALASRSTSERQDAVRRSKKFDLQAFG